MSGIVVVGVVVVGVLVVEVVVVVVVVVVVERGPCDFRVQPAHIAMVIR